VRNGGAMSRILLLLCLLFSGLSGLVYQLIWTRYLGFVFGTTTEAIGSVLAIFFGGLALGNLLAARLLRRVERPLRVYALLELGIGAFALASLPVLQRLDEIYAVVGVDHGPLAMTCLRLLATALLLLPPTVAMGATLPVVARGTVDEDTTLGRWSAWLYGANTLGAVLGTYLCGFWLIPGLGLARSVFLAAGVNLAVAAVVFLIWGKRRAPAPLEAASASGISPPHPSTAADAPPPAHRFFLVLFGISGFVAIGYEMVWARVFGIVMEGTLYGFAAVLAAYLLGIAAGSFAISGYVDRIRDLPRAFGVLHVAIAACVVVGIAAVPVLPFAMKRLGEALGGGDAVHLLFLLIVPIVLLPTMLFGAAFPILIRIHTRRAGAAGREIGLATAANTAGSIAASLWVGFHWIPALGLDATLLALVLLDLLVGLVVLLGFQSGPIRQRVAFSAGAVVIFLTVSLGFNGVQVDRAIAGRMQPADDLARYWDGLEQVEAHQRLRIEGRSAIVTVNETPAGGLLQTNGLPESRVFHAPPYVSTESVMLGFLPWLFAERPENALVIGLGGGSTVGALLATPLERIEVVELEPRVAEAVEWLHRGRTNPIADPRVELTFNDGRNELLLGVHGERPGYDLITSQPSHPWRLGAANLFTEEFFELARANLTDGGAVAIWINGFRIDPESFLAVATSFERVFPGSVLFAGSGSQTRPRESLLLLGGRRPLHLHVPTARTRLAEPDVWRTLALHGIHSLEELLGRSEGPLALYAALDPHAANTDDNAYLETRIPRRTDWGRLDFDVLERQLPADAPVLPSFSGELDISEVVRTWLGRPGSEEGLAPGRKLARLVARRGEAVDPVLASTWLAEVALAEPDRASETKETLRRIAAENPMRPEPWRALGLHLAARERAFSEAAAALGAAWERSGSPQDAYDAARALHHVDPEGAWEWVARIPPELRTEFPRIALFQAEQALREGAPGAELRKRFHALVDYRDTPEGRKILGVDAVLARLAVHLEEQDAALAFGAAALRERTKRVESLLKRARAALTKDDAAAANDALRKARELLPGDPKVLQLAATVAAARGDRAAVERALADLRQWAPSAEIAVATENRFRLHHGLPLLPPLQASALLAR